MCQAGCLCEDYWGDCNCVKEGLKPLCEKLQEEEEKLKMLNEKKQSK